MSEHIPPTLTARLYDLLTGGGLGAGLLALLGYLFRRRREHAEVHLTHAQAVKVSVESEQTELEMALKLARELSAGVTFLTAQMAALREENERIRDEYRDAIEYAETLKKLQSGPGEG